MEVQDQEGTSDMHQLIFISIDGSTRILQRQIADVETPFVNREREIVELALINADFILTTKRCITKGLQVTNWRKHLFVFAAQMYGAGKTRIGREFLKQVQVLLKDQNKTAFNRFCPADLRDDLKDLLAIVSEFPSAATEYFDLSTYTDFKDFMKDITEEDSLSKYILGKCMEKKCPVFFHFDEVGNFNVSNLRFLRDHCFRALKEVKDVRSYPLFFFSGRGAAYNELGTTSTSVVGSHWLILEPLQHDHVKEIIEQSTLNDSQWASFGRNIQGEKLSGIIDAMIEWTGGPPRPLLYVIGMVQRMYEGGENFEDLTIIFVKLVKYVFERLDLYKELGPCSAKSSTLDKTEVKVYHYFVHHSWQKTKLLRSFRIPEYIVGTGQALSDNYLRSFNIFAKSDGSEFMRLVTPTFVSTTLKKETFDSFKQMLELSLGGAEYIFEDAVLKAALLWDNFNRWTLRCQPFPHLIPEGVFSGEKVNLYRSLARGPKVNEKGKLSRSEMQNRWKAGVEFRKMLPPTLLGDFYDELRLGEMVMLAPESSSCDLVAKIERKLVVELQMKSGKQKLSHKDVEEEVIKSVVVLSPNSNYRSIFVLVCASGISFSLERKPITPRNNISVCIPTVRNLQEYFGDCGVLENFQ